MILARSPLRTTLCGGGTDLPSYYRDHGGFLIAAAIDKYVHVAVTEPFAPGIHLRHSKIEHAATVDEVRHPIIRESLRLLHPDIARIEITTFADVPSGTGLGSSGSFTTALLSALHAVRGVTVPPIELAEQACHIEIDVLGAPIGKQDQYIAAFGGVTCFTFPTEGRVTAEPLALDAAVRATLEERLLLFFTGFARSASDILRDQDRQLREGDRSMIERFDYEKENALQSRKALETGDLPAYGRLLREHWDAKRKRLGLISSPRLDHWYNVGLANGASGGKLIGAGGGGFLMFLADDTVRLRNAMREEGLVELPFHFESDGARVIAR